MKLKPSLLLVTALSLTAVLASALAQDTAKAPPPPAVFQAAPGPITAPPLPAYPQPPTVSEVVPVLRTEPGRPLAYYGAGGSWSVSQEEMNLTHETEQVVRQLGEAKSDSDKEKLRTKLNEILEKQFDQRQKRHEHEIEALEAQVKKLRELVQKRNDNRRDIVSKRLDQILRDAQGLGW
jgi:hypothetical protein